MPVPKILYSEHWDRWYVEDEYSGKYGVIFPTLGIKVAYPDLPEDTVELIPTDAVDKLFSTLTQIEMELCDILGLEWLLTDWVDIQTAVADLVKYPKYLVISETNTSDGDTTS